MLKQWPHMIHLKKRWLHYFCCSLRLRSLFFQWARIQGSSSGCSIARYLSWCLVLVLKLCLENLNDSLEFRCLLVTLLLLLFKHITFFFYWIKLTLTYLNLLLIGLQLLCDGYLLFIWYTFQCTLKTLVKARHQTWRPPNFLISSRQLVIENRFRFYLRCE